MVVLEWPMDYLTSHWPINCINTCKYLHCLTFTKASFFHECNHILKFCILNPHHVGAEGCGDSAPCWLAPVSLLMLPLGLLVHETEQGKLYPVRLLPASLLSPHDTDPGHVADIQRIATFCQILVHLKSGWIHRHVMKKNMNNINRGGVIISYYLKRIKFIISLGVSVKIK